MPFPVPVVDLSPFTAGGDIESKKKAAKDLAEKTHINGCVGICGHGVAPKRLAQAFDVTKSLFDLPYEEKMKAPHPDAPVPHRGYSGPGRERAVAKIEAETENAAEKEKYANASDIKESYEIGSDENTYHYNIWLPDDVLPGFRKFTSDLFWELHETASAVLDALIMSLDLNEQEKNNVRALHTGHDNSLRLLHYPPVEKKQGETSRLGAHTDWSLFTLLFQDANGGLEFLDRASNEYFSATPRDGVVYMNIGDMFQRISNGYYPSAFHRVVVNGTAAARYSIPYFVSSREDGLVEPQQSRIEKDGRQVYEPVIFGEYSKRMFERTRVYS